MPTLALNCSKFKHLSFPDDLFEEPECNKIGFVDAIQYQKGNIYIKLSCNHHGNDPHKWMINTSNLNDDEKRTLHNLVPRWGNALALKHSLCGTNPYACTYDKKDCFDYMINSIKSSKK
jgi:hypothetical protein